MRTIMVGSQVQRRRMRVNAIRYLHPQRRSPTPRRPPCEMRVQDHIQVGVRWHALGLRLLWC